MSKLQLSNYERYQQAAFNQPSYYPLNQSVSPEIYRPIASWIGRLILPTPEQRQTVKGALLEVHHAAPEYQHLVGQVVNLRWSNDPQVQAYVRAVTKDVNFNAEAEHSQEQMGFVHPVRLNHWRLVDPLESLAGARPNNDMLVMLREPVIVPPSVTQGGEVDDELRTTLLIASEPVQITGRFYALVQILQPVREASEQFRVVHFNRASGQFDGVEEVVWMPQVIANRYGVFPSTNRDIEKSPLNPTGWYIYGAKDSLGMFVVQAIAPRALFRLQPDRVILGKQAAIDYTEKQSWQDIAAQKGRATSVLVSSQKQDPDQAISQWQEGDLALVIHTYGGIGGKKREPAAKSIVYLGHFAYGVARVVREPLTDELRFDIEYHQVYCQNTDGLIAGTLSWTRYMGDRQWGWLGIRPIADILIKLDAVTADYKFDDGVQRSPLSTLVYELEIMTARYRIGDGTGGTYVSPANNCSQDANQAMYATLKRISDAVQSYPDFQGWLKRNPEQAERFKQLVKLGESFKHELLPFGTARADWQDNAEILGTSIEDHPLKTIFRGLLSWRTILPRMACDSIAQIFLEQGASAWVLRTNQVGGFDPDIEPVAPTRLW